MRRPFFTVLALESLNDRAPVSHGALLSPPSSNVRQTSPRAHQTNHKAWIRNCHTDETMAKRTEAVLVRAFGSQVRVPFRTSSHEIYGLVVGNSLGILTHWARRTCSCQAGFCAWDREFFKIVRIWNVPCAVLIFQKREHTENLSKVCQGVLLHSAA